jgi:hypothetical protein
LLMSPSKGMNCFSAELKFACGLGLKCGFKAIESLPRLIVFFFGKDYLALDYGLNTLYCDFEIGVELNPARTPASP